MIGAGAVETIAVAALRLIEKGIDREAALFEALTDEERREVAQRHYAALARWDEHGKNIHTAVITIFKWLRGLGNGSADRS